MHVRTLASNDILFWEARTRLPPFPRSWGALRLLYCLCFGLSSLAASMESASFSIFARRSQACPRTGKRRQRAEQGSALSQLCLFPQGGQGNRERRGSKQSEASTPAFLSQLSYGPADPLPCCSQESRH